MFEAHKEVMRCFVEETINNENLSVLDEVAYPNYVYRSPGQELYGPEGFIGRIAAYRNAFPDLNMEIDDLDIEGDKAIIYF
ncbi:MAG: ester cyclase [Kovacikia sp.]